MPPERSYRRSGRTAGMLRFAALAKGRLHQISHKLYPQPCQTGRVEKTSSGARAYLESYSRSSHLSRIDVIYFQVLSIK